MKKLLTILTLALLFAFGTSAQMKIGSPAGAPQASSILDLSNTGGGNRALLLPSVANTAAIVTPVNGMLIYDLSSNCTKSYQNGAWSGCLGAATSSVAVDCAASAINGTYNTGVPLSGTNTVTIVVVNNSFTTASITPAAGDIILSGPGAAGMTVGTPTPNPANPAAGGGTATITYPLTGTLSTAGSFTATWTKLSLTCAKTSAVCTAMSAITVTSSTNPATLPVPTVAGNTVTFTAAGGTPNTGVTWAMSSSPAGQFSGASSGSGTSAIATLIAGASGSITTTFTATNSCGSTVTGFKTVSVGDAILGAIVAGGNGTDYSNYNSASPNAIVNISQASYLQIQGISTALSILSTNNEMLSSGTGGGQIFNNRTIGFPSTVFQGSTYFTAGNYFIAFQLKSWGNSNAYGNFSGGKIKFSSSSTSGFSDYSLPFPSITYPAINSYLYFVIKTPTTALPATPNMAMYAGTSWGQDQLTMLSNANTLAVPSTTGDVNTFSATTQSIYTKLLMQAVQIPTKQW